MTTSTSAGDGCRARKPKLAAGEETLAELGRYGEVMFSEAETAAAMKVSASDLSELLEKSKKARMAFDSGRMRTLEALRRAQFKHAQTNASMAMFLGRTYLGQSEQREGEYAEPFDFTGASRRFRDKLAALAAAAHPASDRPGS